MSNYNSKLKSDISEIFISCCNGKLNEINLEWSNKKSLCIVVCSKGYPEEYKKNVEIKNIKNITTDHDEFFFHAGTTKKDGNVYAIGGRVLNFVSLSDDFGKARNNLINKINILNWDEGFYRKDIGYKVIK